MKPVNMHVPQNVSELITLINSLLTSAPQFLDRTGYMPFLNLDFVFQELSEGLSFNRSRMGEERCHQLMQMSDEMRRLFEADPDDKTGQTLEGCKIIHKMEDILRDARRKS
jgi:hypothetical protein